MKYWKEWIYPAFQSMLVMLNVGFYLWLGYWWNLAAAGLCLVLVGVSINLTRQTIRSLKNIEALETEFPWLKGNG